MTDLPTTEPRVFTAGDTLRFVKDVPGYVPAEGWTLSYAMANAAGSIQFSSSDNGDGRHLVDVDFGDTADWTPGVYRWQAYASKFGERHTVGRGQMEIRAGLASLENGDGLDARGKWQTILDNLENAYAQMSAGEIKSSMVAYGSRTVTFRGIDQLITAISHARQMAAREGDADGISASVGVRIHTRF